MQNISWHASSVSNIAKHLHTYPTQGLSTSKIQELKDQYGPNKLDDTPPVAWWKRLANELNDYLIYILIAGAILSISVGETLDGALILAIIGLMATMGFVQNTKAETALANLTKLTVRNALVIREGQESTIDIQDLVPGDLVKLKAGDIVPADLRITEEHNATIDESTLTGESINSSKSVLSLSEATSLSERKCMAYSGTSLVSGRLQGIVVATGMQTELGKIAKLLSQTSFELSPLEIQLSKLGQTIGTTLLGLVSIVFMLNLWHGKPLLDSSLEAIALSVAAVPEGLPAVITICLAFGTREMVRQKALVRKLKAVESLGSVSIVATDKTGTLTGGFMTVSDVWELASGTNEMLQVAMLCNNHSDMTETALLKWVKDSAIELATPKRIAEFEFNSLLKRMSTIHDLGHDKYLVAVKGAPEIIIEHSKLTSKAKMRIQLQLKSMTARGLRVLALARKLAPKDILKQSRTHVESNLDFLGLVGISDPPKAHVKEALMQTRKAGITPIMITGDNPETARAIATQLGFTDEMPMQGPDIDGLEDIGQLTSEITKHTIFARVTPAHKSIIVQSFQKAGHFVAMIGDGVNDAPSIKLANVGVAMGIRGSDVTKGAADLVLLDDNYQTLVVAIHQGRAILSRIRLFVSYLLSCNIAEVALFIAFSLLGFPFPLTPIMLLLLNIVTDAAPALAMAKEPGGPDLMTMPPRASGDPIISRPMWYSISWITLVTVLVVIYSYMLGGQTMAFTTLSFLELMRAYTARSLTQNLYQIGVFTNPWITPSVIFGILVTLIIVYVAGPFLGIAPLSPSMLGLSFALALIGPLGEELAKPILRKIK